MSDVLRGACACGAVRFEVEDQFVYAHYCHCSQCRASTGSAFAVIAGIERSKLVVVGGADRIEALEKHNGNRANRCAACGGPVFTFVRDALVEVPMGVLREAPRIRPSFHAFVVSKAPWYEIGDGLLQYPRRAPRSAYGAASVALEPRRTALSPKSSRSEYARRLKRVFEYIDAHLDEPIDLEAVAGVAHFSPFHFHRVFVAWMGETPGEYLRGRRLDSAARQLVDDATSSVLGVALAVGFGSGEAFARAFKQRFGCTPSAWRALSSAARAKRQNELRKERSEQFRAQRGVRVKVIDFPSTRVACLRHVGPLGAAVGAFWRTTVFPWLASNGLSQRPRYGIALDDPDVTPGSECRYDACVEVPEGFTAKRPAGIALLPGGRYAVRAFAGTAATIGGAWTEVLRNWLPSSAMQMDSRPLIEYYPAGSTVDGSTGAFACELWVPVKPL